MSHGNPDLDELIRSAHLGRSARRWNAQRAIFRRLGLGGGAALLLERITHALSSADLPKWAVGGAGITLVAGSAFVATQLSPTAPKRIESASELVAGESLEPPLPSAPSAPAQPIAPTISVDALPSAPPPTSKSWRPTHAAASAFAVTGDDLSRETASISSIRSKITARQYASALDAVRAHRATFPRGILTQEAAVLEIQALEGLGDDARTCSEGKAFLDANPTSAHRTRVLGMLRACNQ